MKPKISVLVPAYNVALWLPSCLDSILAQTYQNLEIIVVNDGSTDNTGTILDSYAKKNGRDAEETLYKYCKKVVSDFEKTEVDMPYK